METFEINVNLNERSFSIKGTEEYIDRKLKEIMGLMDLSQDCGKQVKIDKSTTAIHEDIKSISDGEQIHYQKYVDAGLISVEDGNVIILRQVPGKNNAAKMKNVALITMFALDTVIEPKILVENCEKLNCYDSKNFSSAFKNDKSGNFIRKGKGQSWSLKLTLPGKDAAISVLEEMLNGFKK